MSNLAENTTQPYITWIFIQSCCSYNLHLELLPGFVVLFYNYLYNLIHVSRWSRTSLTTPCPSRENDNHANKQPFFLLLRVHSTTEEFRYYFVKNIIYYNYNNSTRVYNNSSCSIYFLQNSKKKKFKYINWILAYC